MEKKRWIESLLDDMVESQWSEDIIRQEYERFARLNDAGELKSLEDLEPINQYSLKELEEQEILNEDFKRQIENFSKSDYQDYLIGEALSNIREDEYFEEMEYDEDYLENLIRRHLAEEKDFLDMVMKEAIAEDEYFQNVIEKRIYDDHFLEVSDFSQEDDFVEEYLPEKDVFDDLGDTSYMDQGIFHGADTDSLEEPFHYTYYEQPFSDEDLVDAADFSYLDESQDDFSSQDVSVGDFPNDLIVEEPDNVNLKELIRERLFEEKYLDRIFVEIIKKDDYWDRLIKEKLACDEKLNAKIDKLS